MLILVPMAKTRFVLAMALILRLVATFTPPPKSVYDQIRYWNRLRKFSNLIQQHNLTRYLEREDITVFVPLTSSYNQFADDAARFGYSLGDAKTMEEFLLFHIGEGAMAVSDIVQHSSIRTFHPNRKHLYFNVLTYGDTQVYSVNGALITTPDIIGSNGVVHIVDRFIAPIQSNKTVADYLENPDVPNLGFRSITLASIIDPELKNKTSSNLHRFTVFAPNDSYITTMPDYGQNRLFSDNPLLTTVFWAHVIEHEIQYIPRLGDLHDLPAKAGVIKFYRVGSDVFVSNNKVRARIVQANIPASNGVIHVIDDLLFFIYRNIRQKLDVLKNVFFVTNSLPKADYEFQARLENETTKMTFFVPTSDAFAKLPTSKQIEIDNDAIKLTQMFQDHLIMYDERDVDSFQDGETFTTSDGKILSIHRNDRAVYVEGGGIKAEITTPDIGCTNGVIHLISNVLFQRDFTIWDVIQENTQLREMQKYLLLAPDLINQLNSVASGPLTVFLISDAAYNNLPNDTINHLTYNKDLLKQAIQGSIAHGRILSTSQITTDMDVSTLSGQVLTLYHTNQGVYIIGSRIRANVVIKDIWCSNGILHITDNILHLPTRNIVDEMRVQPSLSVMAGIMQAFGDLSRQLRNTSRMFTMFVPNDDAFTYMPTHRAKKLSVTNGLLYNVLTAHVTEDVASYIEVYGNYTVFKSLKGLGLFLVKSEDKAYAVSNNVKGEVVNPNIRCTNGMIHVVDTLLDFPYWTVAETMEEVPELRHFDSILRQVDEFYSWSSMHDIQQTLFVPSGTFLSHLSESHKTFIMTEPGLIRKIYESHFLPGASLSQQYLDEAFSSSRVFLTENRYNVTFTLMDRDLTDKTARASVDIGYTNLRQSFDLVKDGIGCSNGVIFIINGFVNYPLNRIPTEIARQPEISIGTDLLVKLIPKNSSVDLDSTRTVYTMFAPADEAFNFLTLNDINYVNDNLTYPERMAIVRRHIVKGQSLSYDAIMNGHFGFYSRDHNMTVLLRTDGVYLRWKDIDAKIIRPNILASNGIIHVVDRFLLSTPYQTTTVSTSTVSTTEAVSSADTLSMSHLVQYLQFLLCFNIYICIRSLYHCR